MPMSRECKVSSRPYTAYRFKPGPNARYKETVISKEVALAKNICQAPHPAAGNAESPRGPWDSSPGTRCGVDLERAEDTFKTNSRLFKMEKCRWHFIL